jgi:hypothetical protein
MQYVFLTIAFNSLQEGRCHTMSPHNHYLLWKWLFPLLTYWWKYIWKVSVFYIFMTEHFLLVSTYIHDKDAIHTKCIVLATALFVLRFTGSHLTLYLVSSNFSWCKRHVLHVLECLHLDTSQVQTSEIASKISFWPKLVYLYMMTMKHAKYQCISTNTPQKL